MNAISSTVTPQMRFLPAPPRNEAPPECHCHDHADSVEIGGAAPLEAPCADTDGCCPPSRLLGQTGAQTALAAAAGVGAFIPEVIQAPHAEITSKLKEKLGERPFHIPAARAEALAKELNLTLEQLMVELIPVAQASARTPISHYNVGAVGQGTSGDLYLGVNLEFGHQALNQSVHGEQFVTANAMHNGEAGLARLAISAEPCGHCRQFLNELAGIGNLRLLIPNQQPVGLATLLPRSFGPKDLGIEGALLKSTPYNLEFSCPESAQDPAAREAMKTASTSYSPYSKCPSGVAVVTNDGKIFSGAYAENAAFNPSLSPLQAAFIQMTAAGHPLEDAARIVLVEQAMTGDDQVSQELNTKFLAESVVPKAKFEVVQVKVNPSLDV